jgi:hypothetical protein
MLHRLCGAALRYKIMFYLDKNGAAILQRKSKQESPTLYRLTGRSRFLSVQ